MHRKLKQMELRLAFWWTCESCGRDNWKPLVYIEAPPGYWYVPDDVKCVHCGADFKSDHKDLLESLGKAPSDTESDTESNSGDDET